jgi:hypothetical protein
VRSSGSCRKLNRRQELNCSQFGWFGARYGSRPRPTLTPAHAKRPTPWCRCSYLMFCLFFDVFVAMRK